MADSETTVPAEEQAVEQTPDAGEAVADDTQLAADSGENNDTAGDATQQADGEGQDAGAENSGSDGGAAAADGEVAADSGGVSAEGGDAAEEQGSAEEPAATEPAEPEAQQESEPQQEPEPETEADPKEEEQQEAEQEEPTVEETQAVELSEEEKAKCQKMFDRKAVDGRLDIKGFKILFRLMGQVLSSEAADAMFKEVNSAENGDTIGFEDFCVLYGKFCEGEQTRKEDLMNSINKLFPNSNGEPVRLKNVEGLLMKLQQPDLGMRLVREKSDLNPSDIKSLVRSMDKNGHGYISREEFVETLTRHLDTM